MQKTTKSEFDAIQYLKSRKNVINIAGIEKTLGTPRGAIWRAVQDRDILPKHHLESLSQYLINTFLNTEANFESDEFIQGILNIHSKAVSMPVQDFQDEVIDFGSNIGKVWEAIKLNSPKQARSELIQCAAHCLRLISEIDKEQKELS